MLNTATSFRIGRFFCRTALAGLGLGAAWGAVYGVVFGVVLVPFAAPLMFGYGSLLGALYGAPVGLVAGAVSGAVLGVAAAFGALPWRDPIAFRQSARRLAVPVVTASAFVCFRWEVAHVLAKDHAWISTGWDQVTFVAGPSLVGAVLAWRRKWAPCTER